MSSRFLADTIVVLHFAFVLFALMGGLIAIWWRKIIWLHIPAILWAALVEFAGWICPLTPLENWLRRKDEGAYYSGGFVEHYMLPILYPAGLTREIQVLLGTLVLLLNLLIYFYVYTKHNPGLSRQKDHTEHHTRT